MKPAVSVGLTVRPVLPVIKLKRGIKMKNLTSRINHSVKNLLLLAAWTLSASSCYTIWDNDDCGTVYQVHFKYDYNMAFADAFASQVHSVTLYAFDEEGKLVSQQQEQGEILSNGDFSMSLNVAPGNYQLVAWAGMAGNDKVTLTEGVSSIDELKCRINRTGHTLLGEQVDSVGLLNPFWHGTVKMGLGTESASRNSWNYEDVTVPLVKNSNTLRIILQQMSGEGLDKDDFVFSVTDNNGLMHHDNSLNAEDGELTYLPYYKASGSTDINEGNEADTKLNMVIAEMSMGRLMADHHPVLTVRRADTGKVVFSIPLIDYMDMCRTVAQYDMPLQEYLDREDTYVMTFFLDANQSWINTQIIINDWIVRYNDITPEF